MGAGRIAAAGLTASAVAACAVLAVTMARAEPERRPVADPAPAPTWSTSRSVPVYRVLTPAPHTTATSRATASSAPRTTASPTLPTTSSSTSTPAATSRSATPAARTTSSRPAPPPTRSTAAPKPSPAPSSSRPSPSPKPPSKPKPKPKPHGSALPLPGFSTGSATQVITVVAHSYSSTTATVQAWTKASGGGWFRHGPAIYAHVGSQGLTRSPSEWKSATPIGSFSLTQAFGRYSDPGTALPYFKTDAADWWISQSGPLYNTHQHCWSGCRFTQGSPNEHLYYVSPHYNYAVVINYNRFPVHQGAGSAFFLHVSVGSATAGCVAIPQSSLTSIMRWLTPSAHPRILIGVT